MDKKQKHIISIIISCIIMAISFTYTLVHLVKYYDAWEYGEVHFAILIFIVFSITLTRSVLYLSKNNK